jgi:hypothetical protein
LLRLLPAAAFKVPFTMRPSSEYVLQRTILY